MKLSEKRLTELLIKAEKAHARYQKKLGRIHKNWPKWYAKFILDELK